MEAFLYSILLVLVLVLVAKLAAVASLAFQQKKKRKAGDLISPALKAESKGVGWAPGGEFY